MARGVPDGHILCITAFGIVVMCLFQNNNYPENAK